MLYIDPTTGAVTQKSIAAPTITGPALDAFGLDKDSWQTEGLLSVKGKSDNNIQRDMGAYWNAMFGDFRVPHGALEGRQTRLAAALVADTGTTMNVDEDTDEYGNALFAAGMMVTITSVLPESLYRHHQEEVSIDVVEIGTAYVYGTTAKTVIPIIGFGTAGAIGKAFAAGAFVQPAKVFPGSMGVNGIVGALASYERPDAVSTLTGVTAVTAQIDTITWAEYTQLRTSGGVVGGFDIYILKKGEGVCVAGPPKGIKEHFIPSVAGSLPTVAASVHTVSTTTQYYNQSTNALATIDNGTFYVCVFPVTASDIGERTHYGAMAVDDVVVPA